MLMCITIVGIPLGLQHFKMAFGSKNGGICSRTAKKTPAGWSEFFCRDDRIRTDDLFNVTEAL